MRLRSGLLALSLTLLWSAAAIAVPPPKTDADMLALADLVVDAKSAAIVCDGKPIETAQKTVTNYVSTLQPSKAYKGTMPNSFKIRGKTETWKISPRPSGGWFQEAVPEGWAGKLYLKKASDGTYSKVWWNADQADKALSAPKPLPACAPVPDGGLPDSGPTADAAPGVDSQTGSDSVASDGASSADVSVTNPPPLADEGCSCSAGRTSPHGAPLWLTLGLLGLLALRRRRA